MLGLGPQLEDDKANEISRKWGRDAMHPLPATYETMATVIESEVLEEGARYIHNPPPPKSQGEPPSKCQKIDQSKLHQGWVDGCSAALP
jgi:hypothetical protein